jgi:hypothetical protein
MGRCSKGSHEAAACLTAGALSAAPAAAPGAPPPVSVTLRRILSASFPGAIYLSHASSRSNVNALAKAIHGLKTRGFARGTLQVS